MIAFGNFLYVANRTNDGNYQPDGTPVDYSGEYYGMKPLDAVISIYMLGALGDFDTGKYLAGYEKYSMFAMFLLATFTVAVIFMNMLIAIMSNTFSEVLDNEEQNGLLE